MSAKNLVKKDDKSPVKLYGRLGTSPSDIEEEDGYDNASSDSFKFEFVSLLFRKLRQFF